MNDRQDRPTDTTNEAPIQVSIAVSVTDTRTGMDMEAFADDLAFTFANILAEIGGVRLRFENGDGTPDPLTQRRYIQQHKIARQSAARAVEEAAARAGIPLYRDPYTMEVRQSATWERQPPPRYEGNDPNVERIVDTTPLTQQMQRDINRALFAPREQPADEPDDELNPSAAHDRDNVSRFNRAQRRLREGITVPVEYAARTAPDEIPRSDAPPEK